jgi:hypothetical protein
MSTIDWEFGESYRKTAGRPEEERLELLMRKWRDVVCGPTRDAHFFAGTAPVRHHWDLLAPEASGSPAPGTLALLNAKVPEVGGTLVTEDARCRDLCDVPRERR